MKLLYVGRAVERQKRFFSLVCWFECLQEFESEYELTVVTKDFFQTENKKILVIRDDNWYHSLNLSDYIIVLNSEYEGSPLVLWEFLNNGGSQIALRRSSWNVNTFPSCSLFNDFSSFKSLIEAGGFKFENLALVSKYVDIARYSEEVERLKTWLEN